MPSWLLQRVQGVRPDVTIINLALAHASETWLREQFARLKIDVDVAGFPRERPAFLSALTRALVGEARPVYVALTVPARHRSSIERDLKLCGLAARLDPAGAFDADSALVESFSRYRLDSLRHGWYGEFYVSFRPVVRRLNTNYAYGLLALAAIDPQHPKWSRLARHLAATSDDRHFADHVTAQLESLR
jgi:hypothetical protein